jgi:hypothetical protein
LEEVLPMIAKAVRDPQRPLGLRARLARFLRSPFAAARERREAEDARDLALIEEVRAQNNPRIPHEEVMRRHGLL